ncbi:nicotinate-nucleotide--dimethylbenzimidazole phosphoribosyltransferase [Acinetobacter radioresistens]|uniref:nicotinate-nucleotide--dimethylbenzimidazole phosphoribosyltransferase n=1 Tax=Acinetobacter radioresistens TaxID=40216 RepID=UPI002006561D|nr:nicotinate-nucleotide--dimethylbenzimidazole phosphoribosyltransferase [Acinetobacter radioresistens]MCK4088316.1 nicotinate-nucleotide--dimethylbenzimidazole phosphoribosyltransferase [Acinetobacter radioresistens]MCK4109405.1 nicotinate-nucleotide--dimethylbenzimidazole phosphoribosyltransferase [Acinetobacter radioresistens]MCX0332138.1 nicotinate-nucleotide--dimethylbenzimidazole phosphoribosyltransferase [Acinetobacter radioresistens]
MNWWLKPCKQPNTEIKILAELRQSQLTKPSGSLGELEQVAVRLAALQGNERPEINYPWITIFAGDHGVMEENISAYPQAVTRQMLQNFMTGGACISVIAKEYNAKLKVIDCGSVGEPYHYPGVERHCIAPGTANFATQTAMTEEQCKQAMELGAKSVEKAVAEQASLFVAGEMGIGNTCSASAVACLLLNEPAEKLTGVGTGIRQEQLSHKKQVIDQAIELHKSYAGSDVFKILSAVGGLELAAMTGAYIRCAQLGLPIIVDGFISSVSALCAVRLNSAVRYWMLFGHQSAEYGHQRILAELQAQPLLKLNLRLGEASGAGAALGIIKLACALHNQMATFAEAAVIGEKV